LPDVYSVVPRFVEAYAVRDEDAMRSALAPDLTAYVTNAEGGVDRVDGREAYLQGLLALNAPELSVRVTQTVAVAPDSTLTMVEIRAERAGKTLHNFSAFLARIDNEQIVELWMVEALPAYSAEFWQ
jgi:ketosteroid isomerase-like protein